MTSDFLLAFVSDVLVGDESHYMAEKAGLQACGEAMSRALGPEVVRHDQPMR
jgi:hypothetical protein